MRGGFRPGAGGPKGPRGPQKRTLEKLERLRQEEAAREAARRVEQSKAVSKSVSYALGKDVLGEFMMLFRGMAATYQPAPPGTPARPFQDEAKFLKYAVLARDTARELAEYQSPKYRAISVTPTPDAVGPGRPGDDAKVVDLHAGDPARAADAYRRLIAAPLKQTG